MKILLVLLLISSNVLAKTRIENIDAKLTKNDLAISFDLDKPVAISPIVETKDKMVQLVFNDSYVWPKIEKRVGDFTLMAYQYDKDTVRFRVLADDIANGSIVNCRDQQCELVLPLINKNTPEGDEQLLAKLLKEEVVSNEVIATDQVNTVLSGVKRTSWNSYLLEFLGIIIAVIIAVFALINLLRRFVMKKGKFNFFHNTKLINVVASHYIAPKKSINVVTVNDQAFLIAIDEQIHFLTKLDNVNDLKKIGEINLTGTNFDENLNSSEDKDFKLKEDVRISDQIKEKVKSLRSLQ